MSSLYAGVGRTFLSDAFDFGLIFGQGSGSRRGLKKSSRRAKPALSEAEGMSDPRTVRAHPYVHPSQTSCSLLWNTAAHDFANPGQRT